MTMYDRSIPTGSPLSPAGFAPDREPTMSFEPIFARQDPFRDINPPSYALPTSGLQNLPKPPPRKRSSAWDRDNISETLAGIGAGFLSSQNFGEGMGAAAQSIAVRNRQLREASRSQVTYGGPGDRFEITTDPETGRRTYRVVPEFQAEEDRVARAKRDDGRAPDFKETQEIRARALYNISQLPQEQRASAYRSLRLNGPAYGLDTAGMPEEWDDTYGKLGGAIGLSVAQSQDQDRQDRLATSLMDDRKAKQARDAARAAETKRHNGVTERTAYQRLRTPPASVRKPKISSANSDLSYLLN